MIILILNGTLYSVTNYHAWAVLQCFTMTVKLKT